MYADVWNATDVSSEIVAADYHREHLVIQLHSGDPVCLAFDETAVFSRGMKLMVAGDSVKIRGWLARRAVNAICDTAGIGTGGYQIGDAQMEMAGITEVEL